MVFRGRHDRVSGTTTVTLDDKPLNPHTEVRAQHTTGFSWGVAGDGAAQLALAICIEVLGLEKALQVYQQFQVRAIERLRGTAWAFSDVLVLKVVDQIEKEKAQ